MPLNLTDILILIAVFALVVGAVCIIVKNKKRGRSSCGCERSSCEACCMGCKRGDS